MNADDGKNDFALVRKPSSAVERAAPSAKRILSGMVSDSLALAKVKVPVAANHPASILFSSEHIIPSLKANERFAVVREMVAHLVYIGQIRPQDEEVVMNAITEREKEMTTGWGFGLASPRGRVDCVKDIVLTIGVSDSGIDFDALDRQPVKIIVMFIIPANSMSHNVKVMKFEAEFLKNFHKTKILEHILRSKSREEMWSILKPVYEEICSSM